MLNCYYDVNERDHFGSLFKGTWIFDHPTNDRGIYQVLMLDFSMVGGNIADAKTEFSRHCCNRINEFMERYKKYYTERDYNRIVDSTDFADKLEKIQGCAVISNAKLCLLVDEYDNFTNTILASSGHNMYHQITHANGFYRDVFKKFKPIFNRIVLTGVSPVTFNDLTSGFNIATDVTMYPEYNATIGFSTEEVQYMLRYYQERDLLPTDTTAILKEMTEWYDGYCFSEDALEEGEQIFNSTMVINYLRYYIRHNRPPKVLVDKNTRTDYDKLRQLVKLDSLNGDRKKAFVQIAQDGYTIGDVCDSFQAEKLTNPDMFTSLLFYYGMLTYVKREPSDIVLGIPNKNVRKLFYDYLMEEYNKILPMDVAVLAALFHEAAVDGKWKEMMAYLCQKLHESSSIRCMIEGERNAQGFLLAYLSLGSYYLTAPEVEVNHGYCDFFLMPNTQKAANIAHSYIIELKYLSATDTDTKAAAQWQEAVAQLNKYVQAPKVRLLSRGTTLHGIVLQIKGTELWRTEESVALTL
jgi:hypothetical protein